MNAAGIARALGDALREGRTCRCRCPFHCGRTDDQSARNLAEAIVDLCRYDAAVRGRNHLLSLVQVQVKGVFSVGQPRERQRNEEGH